MKTFRKFRADQKAVLETLEPNHDLSELEFAAFSEDETPHRFLTKDECLQAYHEGIADGSIGKCPNCGSPNLTSLEKRGGEWRTCVDCGQDTRDWHINEDGEGAPTNNMGSGNIPGANIPAGSHFGEPGVPIRKKFQLMNGPPVDPRMFSGRIFGRNPPVK